MFWWVTVPSPTPVSHNQGASASSLPGLRYR